MARNSSLHKRRPTAVARRLRILAVLLALLAISSAGIARARQNGDERPSYTGADQSLALSPPGGSRSSHRAHVRPTSLRIDAIGVSTPLVSLGLNVDKTVEVPADPGKAGWYSLGPAPGSPGSAVILGHVDSVSGPAVFARLRTLRPGALVAIRRSDGSVARFAVRSVATYANDDFPAARVYRNRGTPTLRLMTCGGAYDRSHGGYQANVVVTAYLR